MSGGNELIRKYPKVLISLREMNFISLREMSTFCLAVRLGETMNCEVVEHWLLAERSDAALPAEVRHHLAECTACLRQRSLLRQLDRLAHEVPVPPANPAIKAALWDRLEPREEVPQEPPMPVRSRRRSIPFHTQMVALATCVLLLIGVGLIIGRLTVLRPEKPDEPASVEVKPLPPREKQPKTPSSPQERLVYLRLADRNVQLAAATSGPQRVDSLTHMAEELQTEAVSKARQGPLDEVARLVRLYQIVLQSGVAGQAFKLPPNEREAVSPRLVKALTGSAAQVDKAVAASVPAVADLLRPMAISARVVAAAIVAGKSPAIAKVAPLDDDSLDRLVQFGLRLADEPDPLRRADVSADLANFLSHSIVLYSVSGDDHTVGELGTSLGALIETGIGDNLDRAASDDWTGDRQPEIEKVRLRASQPAEVLEQNLAKAPAAAAPAIQKALDTSRHGWEKAAKGGKGKGKGPPKTPPGLQKK